MDIYFGLGPGFKYLHLLLISLCGLLINVMVYVSIINISFSAAFLMQNTDNFSF